MKTLSHRPRCSASSATALQLGGKDGRSRLWCFANYRDELYKECAEALQYGLLLVEKDFKAIKGALREAFLKTDTKLLKRATAVFIGDDELLISHIGYSSAVLSRSGKAEVLTSPHRPYGSTVKYYHININLVSSHYSMSGDRKLVTFEFHCCLTVPFQAQFIVQIFKL